MGMRSSVVENHDFDLRGKSMLYPNHIPPKQPTKTPTHNPTPNTLPLTALPPLQTAPIGHSPSSPRPLCSCTFSTKAPITFPAGAYSHTTYHPGASPWPPVWPALHSVRLQPTCVVFFQTSWLKWPVAVLDRS